VNNISGMGGLTRGGSLFALTKLRNDKGPEKASDGVIMERAKSFLNGKTL